MLNEAFALEQGLHRAYARAIFSCPTPAWGLINNSDCEGIDMPRNKPSVFFICLSRGPRFAACALILLFITATVSASPTGSIAGSVKDPSGSAISGARLTLTQPAPNTQAEPAVDTNAHFPVSQL